MIIKNPYMAKSKSDDWETPKELYDKLDKEFNFDFDPCPLNPKFDGLEINWNKCNFVNPPYSQLKEWIKKCYEQSLLGKTVVMLIPSRTDTIAFHEYIYGKAEIRFIKGRVKFKKGLDKPAPAPFASMIVIFKEQSK